MQNLRIVSVQIINSSNIEVKFTDNLTSNLVTSNVSIIADTPNVPSSEVLGIRIKGQVMSITCQPLTPLGAYFIQFQSTPQNPFISIHGTAKMPEDGVTNRYLILGPLEPENPVKNFLDSYLKDNIYRTDDSETIIAKYIKSLSIMLSRALYDIRQVKNENYLSFTVLDERKVRGEGPFDRLDEEGVYEINRVGRGPTSAKTTATFQFDDFPSYPITLQRQINIESLQADSEDTVGKFNINSLTFNLNNSPVTKVNSIVFTFNTASPIFVYDIETLGYQIKDSRYDQDFGFSYLLLEDNQIRINEKVLEDPNFALDTLIKVDIEYESKNLGVVVDETTISVFTSQDAIREVLPPIINVFNLKHAPIIDGNNAVPTLGGITFTDPNAASPSDKHPAFLVELPFRLNGLPASPGQYSIDYSTGTVYVYGNDLNNDGTGPFPPLATYTYRFVYKSEQDYVYDATSLDIVALPKGNLLHDVGSVSFNYEEVLIPGTDYKAGLHQEALAERVDNRLLALNVLKTVNSPITNVFRILNETSGELYTLDRWSDNRIYFRYNNPPRLGQQIGERVSFKNIINELLFVQTSFTNINSINVFKIFLKNNHIVASTEDSLGSFVNTSLVFSNSSIFSTEKWYNREFLESTNVDRLFNVGEYIVDYENGIVYCAVSSTQDFNLGTATYKNSVIIPQFPHLISVDDLYYQISVLNPKNKQFSYISFEDGSIVPEELNPSDELVLNNTDTAPYQILNKSVGIFFESSFLTGLTDQIKFARGVYEYQDLLFSTHPLNFANVSVGTGFNLTVNSITQQKFDAVQFDGTDYFVNINENIPYLSSNITYTFSVVRVSDSQPLWDISGTIVPGTTLKLVLPGINSPAAGDMVTITYTFTINNLSRVVVDYNKGDYYTDYTYVADEIIVSYEYGDNVLDFRLNKNLPPGTAYFVSYKAGALRDALLRNFGTLVNIPELSNFDTEFNRERYRDALIAALTSFIQGPTLAAIKNIGQTISHIEPEVIESVFQNWSLGNSLLNPEPITTTGSFQLLPGRFNNGVLINDNSQTISFPITSNIRLEEGTFETWISPQWDGLDNDATLTFNITRDGYTIDPSLIFIGAAEQHPELTSGIFTLTKNSGVMGTPNKNKDGVFIFYDDDISGNFKRWYVEVIDGYVSSSSSGYRFKITSDGNFYDAKSLTLPKPSNMTVFTGVNTLTINISGGGSIDEGLTFVSDIDHYIFDFGKEKSKDRLSIFKDTSGYLNFRVFDKDKTSYSVSADVSAWKGGESHHVAASWKLDTRNNKDEMHLFIDGFEVPNIIKYGQKLQPFLHEKFRTVNPEEIIGLADRDIISANDLHTTAGSADVTSSINFSALNIFVGDTIFIDEIGFDDTGYNIVTINGQTLTLDSVMPSTLTNGRFSVNRTQFTVLSDIDVAPNTAVTTIHDMLSGTDLSGTINTATVTSSSINFTDQDVLPGYILRIDDPSLSTTYTILQVSGTSLTIDESLAVSISGATFRIYSHDENEIPGVRAVTPSYSIEKDVNFNNILTISNSVVAGDLILIRTLGLNHRKVKRDYYVWGDDAENVLMTRLPPPISLDEAKITKVILPVTAIGPSNSTLISDEFNSINFTTSQPTNDQGGRTLTVTISGNNADFSSPAQVTIDGFTGASPVSETINFTDYGSLDSVNQYSAINFINVIVKPINSSKNAINVVVKEKYTLTFAESDGYVPVIKFSYHLGGGYNLYKVGPDSVRDEYNLFSGLDINNFLSIYSPPEVAGFYVVTGISLDRKTLFITPTETSLPIPDFTEGTYQLFNVSAYRSGFQNGFFNFEIDQHPNQPFFLSSGTYEIEYFTYTRIKFDPFTGYAYIGSDFNGAHQLSAIIDQVKIYSTMLTDTRVGESIPSNQRSITKDFNSLKPLVKDINTLVLIDFDSYPFTNSADFYIKPSSIKKHFQSSIVVNENFDNSLVFLDDPLVVSNDGILDTKKEGTIEFWINPLFDSANDPNLRFYFDAFGAVLEDVVSVDNTSVKISAPASQILSVKLKGGDPAIDYFAGGKLEIDTQRAMVEERISLSDNTVTVTKPILQVISVKAIGDLTGSDYFTTGSVSTDKKTIYLGRLLPASNLPVLVTYQTTENDNDTINTQVIRLNKKLPYQKSHVVVNYMPKGLQGDRISIFKDTFGYVNFTILASGIDYTVRAQTRWAKNTWHRVKASYKINGGKGTDEIRLFIDGYEFSDVLFGVGAVYGAVPFIYGSSMPGDGYGDGYGLVNNIIFKDPMNELFIGSQYTRESPIFSLIDNFRISNISRPIYAPYGEALDINYNSNLDMAFPVTEDLFTTYLLDFATMVVLNEDFATIKNRLTGLFNFSVNIFDSFSIIKNNVKSQEALEKLIKVLKPANSKVFISYIR